MAGFERHATVGWYGGLIDGTGEAKAGTGAFSVPVTWASRIGEPAGRTSPEELMAAAHAGCFSMKLSFVLGNFGFTPERLETTCSISLENGVITASHLQVTGSIPDITAEKFEECAQDAKANCPVSKAYNMEITIEAKLG